MLGNRFIDYIGLNDENVSKIVLIGYNSNTFDNRMLCQNMPILLHHNLQSYTDNVKQKLYYFDFLQALPKRVKLITEFKRVFGAEESAQINWHDALGDVVATQMLCRNKLNATEIFEGKRNFYESYSQY